MTKITYLIPVFNEVKTIEKAINNIKSIKYSKKEILVIDNGSTDGSQNIIKKIKGIKKILRKKNLGIGKTHIDAFNKATGKYLFRYDSDLEYDHLKSIYILKYAEKNNLDMVFASRLKKSDNLIKKIIERPAYMATCLCTFFINSLYKKKFNDIIGTKLFKIKTIKKIPITCFNNGFDFQHTSRIVKRRFRIGEVFIKYKPRKEGEKKIKFYHMVNAIYEIFKVKFFN